jgi:ribonuclease III
VAWFRSPPDEFELRLGHRFHDATRLDAALTHRSWANEQGIAEHNERLEFLGDAVLGMVAAEWLFARYPERAEGDLARLKAWLVSAPTLARYAAEIGLGGRLRLGVGEERSGGREKASLLADALEAVIAAVYVDGGLEAAQRVIRRFLESAHAAGEAESADPKTVLQELAQARGWSLPDYRTVEEAGPDHEKTFVCAVAVAGREAGRGSGRSKKEAQQRAAAAALELLAAGEDVPGTVEPG